MLPEALSNELCSLKPERRSADEMRRVSALERRLGVEDASFIPRSFIPNAGSRYKEVFAVLQRAPQDAIERMLHDANAMAQKIRRTRFKSGSLDLDFPETKIRLDDARSHPADRKGGERYFASTDRRIHAAGERSRGRPLDGLEPAGGVSHSRAARTKNGWRNIARKCSATTFRAATCTNRREVQKLLQKLGQIPIGPRA